MSTGEAINNNQPLKEQLIKDITSKPCTLEELSVKYAVSIHDLFVWLKTLEGTIHATLSDTNVLSSTVTDEEWLSMTPAEQERFFEHLDSFEQDGEDITLEDIEKNVKI